MCGIFFTFYNDITITTVKIVIREMSDPWPTAFITLKYSTQCVLDSSELGAAPLHELPKV